MTNVIGNPIAENQVKVTFSHPLVSLALGDLNISVNPDQVTWAYGLNTQSYPTYGGEVVQILSCYFDDMTISGTVRSVASLERIYGWFIRYMQYATQNADAPPQYNQQPVTFTYHERSWQFLLWPKSLPGFSYDRQGVTSTWTLTAAVKEPETSFSGATISSLSDQITTVSAFNATYKGEFATFGVATADFGNTGDLENNPFASASAPDAVKGNSTATMAAYLTNEEKGLGDTYNNFVGDWSNQDYTSLPQFPNVSLPSNLKGSTTSASSKQGKVKK